MLRKKLSAVIIAIAMTTALCGCGGSEAEVTAPKNEDMSVPAKLSAQNMLKRFFYTVSMAIRYTEGTYL